MAGTKELSGKLTKGNSAWHYSTMYYGKEFCHDFTVRFQWSDRFYANQKQDDYLVGQNEVTPSWGGGTVTDGTERLAVALMVLAHSGWQDISYTDECWAPEVATRVNRHYQQFAKEVVAHLPDNWSMSKKEVLDWIDRQEKKRKK